MRLLDRYVLREFLLLLLFSLCAFVVIFAIVDLFEKIQDFMDGRATLSIVGRYYMYKVPWVVVQVLPVALLMATFLTLGQMSKFNELTAMVTAGESQVVRMIAVAWDGQILPPCGRCRDFLAQLDDRNADAEVMVGEHQIVRLRELLPYDWRDASRRRN